MKGFFFDGELEDNYWGHIFAETYKEKIYDPFLRGKKDLTIVEIGANVGIVSYYFSQFAKTVFAIEPAMEHFACLSYMLEYNEVKNVKPIRKAIHIENKQLPFFHNKNRTMWSLHQAVSDPNLPSEMVEAITLDKLFEDEGIEHVDLLKADPEGSEIEIFSSEGFSKVASKIDVVVGEAHDWAGRNFNQLREAFKNNGFDFEWVPNDAHIYIARRKK